MSTPRFATTTEAVAAFRAGGKRWVHVDGHLVDLLTYVEPRRVEVMREEPEPDVLRMSQWAEQDRDLCNHVAAKNVAAELANPGQVHERAWQCEVLPELAVPGVECCRACGRPMIGDAGQ